MISIDTIFKIINFLAFLFLMVFLFKKYISPYFVTGKKKFDKDIEDKKVSRQGLQKDLNQLSVDHINQIAYGKTLEEKCNQWAQQMEQDRELCESQREQVKKQMIERKQKQWIFVQHQRCLQQKLPIIFQNVEQYFDQLPSKEKTSKEYCDSLITFMKE